MRPLQAGIDIAERRQQRPAAVRPIDLARLSDEIVVAVAPRTGLKRDVALVQRLNDGNAFEAIIAADASLDRRAAVVEHVPGKSEPRRHGVPVDDAVLSGKIAGADPGAGRRALRRNRHDEALVTDAGIERPAAQPPR